jgi:hypothetical protein
LSDALRQALLGLKQLKTDAPEPARRWEGSAPPPPVASIATLPWTPHQQAVIECTVPRIEVRALAGSGKSAVLAEYARRRSRARLNYVSFNAALVKEAHTRLPSNVRARTFHGLAFSRFGAPLADRLRRPWQKGQLNAVLGLDLPPNSEWRWREVLLQTLQAFMASADDHLKSHHVDRGNWLLAREAGDAVPTQVEEVVAQAERLWRALIDPTSPWPVNHDVYLKLWCLAAPELRGDGVLVDEFQDMTPAVHAWLSQQGGLQVHVGDPNQGIYGFRGARGDLRLRGAVELAMPESFRFGSAIAAEANRALARLGDDRLVGSGPAGQVLQTWDAAPDTVLLARTHAGLLEAALEAVSQGIPLAQAIAVPDRLKAVLALSERDRASLTDPWVAGFGSLEDFEAAVEQAGLNEWRAACRLVRKRGSRLRGEIEALAQARQPHGWTLSTVHGAKGKTFDRVALANDLVLDDPTTHEGVEETHVTYVALTRARESVALHPEWAQRWEAWTRRTGSEEPAFLSDDGF